MKEREEMLNRKEEEMKKELSFWKKKCLSVEETVEDIKGKLEEKIKEDSNAKSSRKSDDSCELSNLGGVLELMHKDIHCVNEGFNRLGDKYENLFRTNREEQAELKQMHDELKQKHEELNQYSMLNNGLMGSRDCLF